MTWGLSRRGQPLAVLAMVLGVWEFIATWLRGAVGGFTPAL